MNKKPTIFVTADLHYDHMNIIKGQSTWKNKNACRDFKSVEDMNEAIIKSINDTVSVDDILYIVGDVAFKNIYSLVTLMREINCKNVHLLLGNHDQNIRDNKKFTIQGAPGTVTEFLGEAIFPGERRAFNVKDLFKGVYSRVELEYKKHKFVLDHYPLETWNQAMHGSTMIHGHVHGALDTSDINLYHKRIDVDWGKYERPLSLDEIIEMMKNRKNLEI